MKDRTEEFKGLVFKNGTVRMKDLRDLEDGRPTENGHEHPSPSESTEFLKQETWDDLDKFLAQVREVRQRIEQLENLYSEMKNIHNKILIAPKAEPEDTRQLAGIVDSFTLTSKTVNQLSKALIQDAEKFSKQPEVNAGGTEARIRRDQIQCINRSFKNVLTDFNTEQVRYKEKCKARMHQMLKIADNQMTDDEIDSAIENGVFFSQKSMLMGEREKKLLYEDVKNRHEDIIKLEKAITELHEMFQDILMLVESQGEILNVIENNVMNATEYAIKANKDVKQAREARHRNMKLKVAICIGVTLLIFLLLMIGVGTFCAYFPFICR